MVVQILEPWTSPWAQNRGQPGRGPGPGKSPFWARSQVLGRMMCGHAISMKTNYSNENMKCEYVMNCICVFVCCDFRGAPLLFLLLLRSPLDKHLSIVMSPTRFTFAPAAATCVASGQPAMPGAQAAHVLFLFCLNHDTSVQSVLTQKTQKLMHCTPKQGESWLMLQERKNHDPSCAIIARWIIASLQDYLFTQNC